MEQAVSQHEARLITAAVRTAHWHGDTTTFSWPAASSTTTGKPSWPRFTSSGARPVSSRWSAALLLAAFELAVRGRGWPAEQATAALLQVAADPATRSPARLAEAGPWWDLPPTDAACEQEDVSALETELTRLAHLLQRQARADLREAGMPIIRATVMTRSVELLRTRSDVQPVRHQEIRRPLDHGGESGHPDRI